jgi:phosphoglycolate phosphatase-like HAD superfamily hydrolase
MDRLVLFDIDGTLLSGGPAKDAFHLALIEVFGTAGPIEEWEFSGKTDPQIARELLREAGLRDLDIDEGLPRFWIRYLAEMERRLPDRPPRALPGVPELLNALAQRGTVALALLTGNVAGGARLKLGAVGLGSWFAVGAYGSDKETRNELPTIAVRRARDHWGIDFAARSVVVVGDTPRDVECGSRHGARTVAVATGRFEEGALWESGADAVLRDLGETDAAAEAILS